MSKILKALQKSTLDQNHGSFHGFAGNFAAVSPVDFTIAGVAKEEIQKGAIAAVVVMLLAGSVYLGIRSTVSLDQTKRQMTELSSLVAQQNRMISQLSARIQETPSVNPQELTVLQTKVRDIEKTVARNEEEMTETVISNNLLKIAVDDLQMSENIFVEKYIMLSQDLKNVQEKINTEGRNL